MVSCNKENNFTEVNEQITESPGILDRITLTHGILKFESENHVGELMVEIYNGKVSPEDLRAKFPAFTSLRSFIETVGEEELATDLKDNKLDVYSNQFELIADPSGDLLPYPIVGSTSLLGYVLNSKSQIIVGDSYEQFGFKDKYAVPWTGQTVNNLKEQTNSVRSQYKEFRSTILDPSKTSRDQCFAYWSSNKRRMTGNYADYNAYGIRTFEVSTRTWKKNAFGGWNKLDVSYLVVEPFLRIHCSGLPSYETLITGYYDAANDDVVEHSVSYYVPSISGCNSMFLATNSNCNYWCNDGSSGGSCSLNW